MSNPRYVREANWDEGAMGVRVGSYPDGTQVEVSNNGRQWHPVVSMGDSLAAWNLAEQLDLAINSPYEMQWRLETTRGKH